jgi:hypothetical protein
VALLPRLGGYEILDTVAGTREKATRSTTADLNAFAQMLYRPLPEDLSARSLLRHALGARPRDLRTIVAAGLGAAVLALAAALGSAVFLLVQAMAILRVQSAAFATTQTGVGDYLLSAEARNPDFR